jgi:signal transduction histidine kinase
VDRYLYRTPYDYRRTVREASVAVAALVELPALLEYLGAVLDRTLGPEPLAVYLTDRASGNLRLAMSRSPETGGTAADVVPATSPLRTVLGSGAGAVLADDPSSPGPEISAASAELLALGGQYAQPIMVDRDLLGFLLLGPKRSGDPYFQEDLDLVSTLVNAAAVAIRNAELYRTIRMVEAERQRNGRLAALGGMASGIAHEIKNPLVAIRSFAELLPERYADEEFRTGFAGVALGEIDRIDGLIDRLRGLASASEHPLVPIDVTEPLDGVLTLLKSRLEQAAVSVVRQFDPDPPRVAGAADQLKQLFLNVLTNAIEAMPAGGEITIRVAAHGALGQDLVVVEVTDTGSGIPGSTLQTVFEPFVTTKARGSGLGLAICRGIVDAHRGSITIRNNDDAPGASVRIELPIADARPGSTAPSPAPRLQ